MALRHTKTSAVADSGDPTLVQPSDWNADHAINVDGMVFPVRSTEPAAAPADSVRLYTRARAGRVLPRFVGPAGLANFVQPHFGYNRIAIVGPATGSTLATLHIDAEHSGHQPGHSGQPRHGRYEPEGIGPSYHLRHGNHCGRSGWQSRDPGRVLAGERGGAGRLQLRDQVGLEALQVGMRSFVGLYDGTPGAPTNVDPLAVTAQGKIGMAINANTGNWNLIHNLSGTAPTAIALGASFP